MDYFQGIDHFAFLGGFSLHTQKHIYARHKSQVIFVHAKSIIFLQNVSKFLVKKEQDQIIVFQVKIVFLKNVAAENLFCCLLKKHSSTPKS